MAIPYNSITRYAVRFVKPYVGTLSTNPRSEWFCCGPAATKLYSLYADTGFIQYRNNSRKSLFLGRCSQSLILTMDVLVASRWFRTTLVTNTKKTCVI
jgi:hypothetical protein